MFDIYKQGKSRHRPETDTVNEKTLSNPYLESRAMWNELYGSVQQRLENSYRLLLILAVSLIISIVGMTVIASQSRIKPFVAIVHGDELITLDESAFSNTHRLEPKIALMNIKRFIRHARKLSIDASVNRDNQLTAFSLTKGSATRALKAFYKTQSSAHIHHSNQIVLNSILRLSDKTFSVRWSEKRIDNNSNAVTNVHHYIAELQYVMQAPSNNALIVKHNPFGFYITHLSWSVDDTV